MNCIDDLLTATLDIVLRCNRHGFDLALRTDDMLERRAKFRGKPAMGDEDESDHEVSAGPAVGRTTAGDGEGAHIPWATIGTQARTFTRL